MNTEDLLKKLRRLKPEMKSRYKAKEIALSVPLSGSSKAKAAISIFWWSLKRKPIYLT